MLNIKKTLTKILETLPKAPAWNEFPQTQTGSGYLDISSVDGKWTELCIEVMINGQNNREYFFVPKDVLATFPTIIYMRQGGFGTSMSGNSCYVTVGAARDRVIFSEAYLFGTNYTSTSIMRVLYR